MVVVHDPGVISGQALCDRRRTDVLRRAVEGGQIPVAVAHALPHVAVSAARTRETAIAGYAVARAGAARADAAGTWWINGAPAETVVVAITAENAGEVIAGWRSDHRSGGRVGRNGSDGCGRVGGGVPIARAVAVPGGVGLARARTGAAFTSARVRRTATRRRAGAFHNADGARAD